jgi:hypothetical protein
MHFVHPMACLLLLISLTSQYQALALGVYCKEENQAPYRVMSWV